MSNSFKKKVQETLLLPRKNKYKKERLKLMKEYEFERRKLTDYIEEKKVFEETVKTVECILTDDLIRNIDFTVCDEKFYFVSSSESGWIMPETARVICEYVTDNPSLTVIYGDEDYFAFIYHDAKHHGDRPAVASENAGGISSLLRETDDPKAGIVPFDACRCLRFFKPEFSPDTLCEFNYINSFAVKGECLKEIMKEVSEKEDASVYLYELAIRACAWSLTKKGQESIVRIPRVLTSNPVKVTAEEFEKAYKDGNVSKVLNRYINIADFHGFGSKYEKTRKTGNELLHTEPVRNIGHISVLIPSKDNPEMLIRCIDGLNIGKEDSIEIIVVDNGSSEINRNTVSEYLNSREYKTSYIYEQSEFNYSHMNNLAAVKASGEVLLLLNDDVEAKGCEWIKKMASYALRKDVGCVGCKLLYPDGNIQHVGISGGIDGPAHKYLGESDEVLQGFGDNAFNRNVLAVTGACMCVAKDKYFECGGLCEELKVGYNDIDLCMNLYDKGYRNIMRNDISHIHHESVSRGVDAKSQAKRKRLREEKQILVSRHRELMTYDPYEGSGADYLTAFERESYKSETAALTLNVSRKETDSEGWIYSSFEKLLFDDKTKKLSAKGYAVVPGIDNMRFDFEMLLIKDGITHSVSYAKSLRNDLQRRFSGTENTELCGFDFECDLSGIESGEYRISFYSKDHGNVRELITESEYTIKI